VTELWGACLNPSGPNYESWQRIFPSRVPLKTPYAILATLGEEKSVLVYMLDLQACTLRQRAQLIGIVAQKFGVTVSEVESEIAARGFPIRAVDVTVSFDVRAFV
jgi:hypothetical protein